VDDPTLQTIVRNALDATGGGGGPGPRGGPGPFAAVAMRPPATAPWAGEPAAAPPGQLSPSDNPGWSSPPSAGRVPEVYTNEARAATAAATRAELIDWVLSDGATQLLTDPLAGSLVVDWVR
jgi:hypothetical protein